MRGALEDAGRLLARRARSERELTDRLTRAGHPEGAVAAAVDRLRELRLVDDRAFARDYVAERLRRSPRGVDSLRHELTARGVTPEAVADALDEVAGDEERRARELAMGLASRMGQGLSPAELAARLGRRLTSRGFSGEAVESALRAALPPEGWD